MPAMAVMSNELKNNIMTNKEIQDLIKLIGKSELSEVKIKDGDFEILIRSKDYFKKKEMVAPVMNPNPPQYISTPAQMPNSSPEGHVSDSKPSVSEDELTTAQAPTNADESQYLQIKSPIVGTFYRSPSPEKGAYVKVGDKVNSGDVVCIVEAMKLFNEIETEVSGTIVKVLVEDASPVEYDQALFLVDPNA